MIARCVCIALFVLAIQIGRGDSEPWTAQETVQPAELAQHLGARILMVGPRILYNGAHIQGAIYAGPASKPEGLETLAKTLTSVPKDQRIVIYCGCCPMEKCPNIRPAFQKVKQLGYSNVRVLIVPTNLHDDWITKGYPVEKGDVPH